MYMYIHKGSAYDICAHTPFLSLGMTILNDEFGMNYTDFNSTKQGSCDIGKSSITCTYERASASTVSIPQRITLM